MMLIAAVTNGVAGRLADRIGRKTVLITGLSLLASGFGLAGICGHPLPFFVLLAVTGIGYGFTPPSLYAIMSDLLPGRRGLGASLVSVTYGIGGAIGAVLASRITAAFGWRTAPRELQPQSFPSGGIVGIRGGIRGTRCTPG